MTNRYYYNVSINWGDGQVDIRYETATQAIKKIAVNHTYANPGIYTVKITWLDWKPDPFYFQHAANSFHTLMVTVNKGNMFFILN